MSKYSVGLDVSAKEIHCCISFIDAMQNVTVKATRKVSNTAKGFSELDTWMSRHHKQKDSPLVVCMEATGIYFENCALFLHKAGYTVSVILPNKAKKYLQASGLKSKNDRTDARGLAQMGAEKRLDSWSPMGEFFYQLRQLTRHHEDLQVMKSMAGNRLHAATKGMYTNKKVVSQLKKQITLIDKQIADSVTAMEELVNSDETVKNRVADICRLKGVGLLTVATVLAETNGFALFGNARQLASFAGYDIVENQSGNRMGKTRISKKGNSHIRRAMYMPALVTVMYKVKPFADLYDRTLAKHNIKMKSYVAVQKKLLTIIYAIWKKNEPFDESYTSKINSEKQKPTLPIRSAPPTAAAAATDKCEKVVPTTWPALHKVSMPGEKQPYASSGMTNIKQMDGSVK